MSDLSAVLIRRDVPLIRYVVERKKKIGNFRVSILTACLNNPCRWTVLRERVRPVDRSFRMVNATTTEISQPDLIKEYFSVRLRCTILRRENVQVSNF